MPQGRPRFGGAFSCSRDTIVIAAGEAREVEGFLHAALSCCLICDKRQGVFHAVEDGEADIMCAYCMPGVVSVSWNIRMQGKSTIRMQGTAGRKMAMERAKSLVIPKIAIAVWVLAILLVGAFGLNALAPQQAHAAGKKMWVIAKETTKDAGQDHAGLVVNYTYQKGVMTVAKKVIPGESKSTVKYKYDKKYRLKSASVVDGSDVEEVAKYKYTFKRNGKGYVTKSVSNWTQKYAYNSKGLLKWTGPDSLNRETYAYDKKKRVKTWSRYYDGQLDAQGTFTYKNGLLKSSAFESFEDYGVSTKDVFKSKNGRIKQKYSYTDGTLETVTTYTYKKVTVPKSLVRLIKAQQNAILISGAMPGGIMPFEAAHR